MKNSTLELFGIYEVTIEEDNIVVISASGPWDEGAFTYIDELKRKCFSDIKSNKWGVLAELSCDAIHTPNVNEKIIQSVKLDRYLGRKGTAILLKDLNYPAATRELFSNIYQSAGEDFIFINRKDIALEWLREKLN